MTLRNIKLTPMAAFGLLLCILFHMAACEHNGRNPRLYHPSRGSIWPRPMEQHVYDTVYKLSKNFEIKVYHETCTAVEEAIARTMNVLHKLEDIAKEYDPEPQGDRRRFKDSNLEELTVLNINLTNPCEHLPHLYMNENYTLTISNDSVLHAEEVWGIIRGLESFSQLFFIVDKKSSDIYLNQTYIKDAPRFSHRGIMVDTARHFISLKKLLPILDAMSMNKLNVLHWHITDDESFPFVSRVFPELSKKGAYTERFQYPPSDVELLLKYATLRGIRIIPEFDMPGHARSFGAAMPSILTRCYENDEPKFRGPINPIRNATYRFLKEFLADVDNMFPDEYHHFGGDEVHLECWSSNPNVKNYMDKNKITPAELFSLFYRKILDKITHKHAIFWQDVFEDHVMLAKNETVIQTWSDSETATKILKEGYHVIYSSPWNLDDLDRTFEKMYLSEPTDILAPGTDASHLLGGEALLWSELVDDRNVLQRLFPRASAVAELLWSPKKEYKGTEPGHVPEEVMERLTEHVCRMQRLGIPAEPVAPGFCFRLTTF